jgi:glycosyltransferase involved in cell wall biosynthesis
MKVEYSIIAPIYNEIDNLQELIRRLTEVMEKTDEKWELVLVDDGSTDGSTDQIRKLALEHDFVHPVIFARNFGHQIAVTAGLDYAQGEAVVIIDADLQDPPELILEMIEKWKEGYQVVYAVRTEREGESWFKRTTAALFYHGCRHSSGYRRFSTVRSQDCGCDGDHAGAASFLAGYGRLGWFPPDWRAL